MTKTFRLTTAFICMTLLIAIKGSTQTVKDFFIPESSFNKVTFYTPDRSTGEPTSMTRTIFYVKKATSYEITDAHFFDNHASAIVTETIEITVNEIKKTKQILTNALGTTNKKTSYNPGIILLKLPPVGQSIEWTIKEGSDITKCTANWTTVTIEGNSKKAIKIKKQPQGFTSSIIEYYVSGIGLWKVDMLSQNGKTQAMDKFNELTNDPTAN